ncbi:UDP-forming cellulose synthase catalytic subunit [Legionella maioricensis]|uniref:Cellulose synthase catalytic subunit [UDP-forming] n=1 Tax=Legionella maioricensis TaxID=2896528 RepID=A0A9X2D345_9GAMM|nr:UDP-forming cellulose synthase catalytic subunit [Legionella maioricensis]MCL9685454.1 UDP-forming cellulose synthase catalytic subunit [Legionella maioricensis]MCL9689194.1 UDP-forming cellulose synthase catalytic subunit [Legionella maioricensis]
MSTILRSLLEKQAYLTMERRYQNYRQHGASTVSAFLATLFVALAWLFLCLESPSWQWVLANRINWFPHISSDRPRLGDFLRYLIQAIWLVLIVHDHPKKRDSYLEQWRKQSLNAYYEWINSLPQKTQTNHYGQKISKYFKRISKKSYSILLVLMSIFSAVLLLLCITQPFTPMAQFLFLIILLFIALSIRHMPGHIIVIMLIVLSLITSSRYMWWRYSTTLIWNDPLSLFFGLLLIFAESYIFLVLILGYFQSIWPLHREPVALPKDSTTWPTVDILIPTYDEELSVIKPGVYAALGIDWPKDKLNIYILDDGNRPLFKKFAHEVGVHYITRTTNEHAKAGNINHALKQTQGEFVAIFDCDHIPAHTFLQLTVGWFLKDPKLGLLQTPHHFFSPDPFERNLEAFQNIPNEGALFYGVIQDGNDFWDATFFCGSAGILRRSALEAIGGFAVESVTEDALTSLRLQRHDYTSAYIRIPMSAGLATESLANHIGQRIRWARGMVQILRIDNPLRGKGLTLPQRLCYFNSILYFLSGIPRLIFFVTPVAFLLFHARILYASALMVILYAFPHIIHTVLANTRIQGKYRHFLWNEIYETVMAWYIAIPTTVALINPRKGKFNVTAKGGLIKERYADWVTARPYLVLLTINLLGLIAGIWRLFFGSTEEIPAVLITLSWVLYNLTIIGGALGVDVETKQVRKSHRVKFAMPAIIARADGHLFPCTLRNYSDSGVGIELNESDLLKNGENIALLLNNGFEEFQFPCKVIRIFDRTAGICLSDLSVKQHIDFIRCTFARADTWALWLKSFPEDQPLQSMRHVFRLDFRGYLSIIEYTPPLVRNILTSLTRILMWIVSFIPHRIKGNQTVPVKAEGIIEN